MLQRFFEQINNMTMKQIELNNIFNFLGKIKVNNYCGLPETCIVQADSAKVLTGRPQHATAMLIPLIIMLICGSYVRIPRVYTQIPPESTCPCS